MSTPPSSKVNDTEAEYQAEKSSDLNAVDLSQIERNLLLTPQQRIVEHQNALNLVVALEAAGKKLRERHK